MLGVLLFATHGQHMPASNSLAPDDSSEPLFVTLGHISRDGLDFRSSRRLQPGQKVLVTLETDEGELQIPATVVHSTESVVRFVVGVKFDLQDSCQTDDK